MHHLYDDMKRYKDIQRSTKCFIFQEHMFFLDPLMNLLNDSKQESVNCLHGPLWCLCRRRSFLWAGPHVVWTGCGPCLGSAWWGPHSYCITEETLLAMQMNKGPIIIYASLLENGASKHQETMWWHHYGWTGRRQNQIKLIHIFLSLLPSHLISFLNEL